MTLARPLTRRDIERIASRSAFAKGEAYVWERRVLSPEVTEDGARIEAEVCGAGANVYSVIVDIDARYGRTPHIEGACSCPVGFNCKHVVATLQEVAGFGPDGPAKGAIQPPAGPAGAPLLPADLAGWIDTLARLRDTETDDYPPDIRQRLIYVLELDETPGGGQRLAVWPMSVRLRKDGTFADKARLYGVDSATKGQQAKFIRPADRDILTRLDRLPFSAFARNGTVLAGEEGAAVLAAMLATGRARWGRVDGAALAQGPPQAGRFGWRLAADGTYRPDLTIESVPNGRAVPLAPPWYVDPAAGLAGPVETGFPPRVADAILDAPPVPARQTAPVRAAIERRLPALAAILPPEAATPERIAGPPGLGVRFEVLHLPPRNYYGYGWAGRSDPPRERVAVARPFFRYGPFEIAADERRRTLSYARDGRVLEVARRPKAERDAAARLHAIGFHALAHWYPYGVPPEGHGVLALPPESTDADWADVLYRDVPSLRAEGWAVEVAVDFPVRLAHADGDIAADLREGSGIDWLELDLGAVVDGERVDLVPAILKVLASPQFDADNPGDRPVYLKLPDGRTLAMPAQRLRPFVAALRELFAAGGVDPGDARLRFSLFDAADLAALEEATAAAGVAWQGGERLREMGRLLRETGGIPRAEIPADFAATLRPYQAHGVDWLQFLRAVGLGGILADDMGLGKTVQALAHLAIEQAGGRMDRPSLVVAPTSLMANWAREAERFAPGLRVLTLHGPERKARFADIAAHDLVLTTYPLIARDRDALAAQPWHLVILDEAQIIKNPNATTTRLVGTLEARHRLCLTGTPLENHLGELWSLFAFLSPGFLGDRQGFNRRWRTPIEKNGDRERRLQLARRVRPFLLRRTKGEVATELPSKTEIVETVEMERPQREVYDTIRLAMHDKVRRAIAAQGLARSHIVVLDALLKLRQACCDPRLLKLETAKAMKAGSAKLDRLMEMLPALVEEGRRVLLFSQFTSMLALIEADLVAAAIPYALLTGSTRDRGTPIRRFQAGKVPLFLVSLKAGGLGLNLTAADTVIHYDPWWNPVVEDQATDRAHRIGQTRPVFVHKLVMASSIEEKMKELKTRKRHLAAGLFDPEAGSSLDLTESDVERLFAPA